MISDTFAGGAESVTLKIEDTRPVVVVSYHWQQGATEPNEQDPLWYRANGYIVATYTPWELDLCLRLARDPGHDIGAMRTR